jgi:hypothetical protein
MCRMAPNSPQAANYFGTGRSFEDLTSGRGAPGQLNESLNKIPAKNRFGAALGIMFGAVQRGTGMRIPTRPRNARA